MGDYENARQLGERALSVLEARPNDPHRGVALFLHAKTAWKQNSDEGQAERPLLARTRTLRRFWEVIIQPLHPVCCEP